MAIRIGIMGFGHIGRQLYKLCSDDDRFDVVAVSDIGRPDILCHLLDVTMGHTGEIRLEGNYLVGKHARTRLMPADRPNEIPWDVFDVDVVIDATGRFRTAGELEPHLANGAPRVITSTVPLDTIDRVILFGINEKDARADDRIVSAGSGSTTATALTLGLLGEHFNIDHATMTSVHAYTSDQSLQDYAGPDYRRSRSGAENIIPNASPALTTVPEVMPWLRGKLTAYALNVPVQVGSMLDVTVSLKDPVDSVEAVRSVFTRAAEARPNLIETTTAPIVSSDVRGNSRSLLVDLDATMLAGERMVKVIAWHEPLAHATRILDIVSHYERRDIKEDVA